MSHGREEDARAHDAREREHTREWGTGKAREVGPGSRKTFPCTRDCCFGEPHTLLSSDKTGKIACTILHDRVGILLDS
jgi:hypothetical protein